jgi:hypothetical protein
MHQDIQTFSDLRAIDTQNQLKVELTITYHGRTVSNVRLNGNLYEKTVWVDLFDPINLEIDLLDFDEGTSGLEVALMINGLEVLPKYQHLSSNKKCYIDTKEPWVYSIPSNFYVWYHNVTGQGFIA